MIGAPKVTPAAVRRILEAPPDFIEMSYLPAWRAGRVSTEALAGAVVAALGGRPYDDEEFKRAMDILEDLGYGDEPARASWL